MDHFKIFKNLKRNDVGFFVSCEILAKITMLRNVFLYINLQWKIILFFKLQNITFKSYSYAELSV